MRQMPTRFRLIGPGLAGGYASAAPVARMGSITTCQPDLSNSTTLLSALRRPCAMTTIAAPDVPLLMEKTGHRPCSPGRIDRNQTTRSIEIDNFAREQHAGLGGEDEAIAYQLGAWIACLDGRGCVLARHRATRADSDDADASFTFLFCKKLRVFSNSDFRNRVGGYSNALWVTHHIAAEATPDVQHMPRASWPHVPQRVLAAEEDASEIGVKHLLSEAPLHLARWWPMNPPVTMRHHAGVVHQDIEPPVVSMDAIHEVADCRFVADIDGRG